ncbi:MAG: hypothetical protein KZQ65_09355 [Candidatus Thiodiazotropha sp. (ex Gloverina cf. vestifex)]|nr:hypothetical protein [Candidatus Thiodiazotropha sp. (ex Gloverina cf. vestifex)]
MLRFFLLTLLVVICPESNASAILKTELGVISATMGSAYPNLPGSPVYTENVLSDVLKSNFSNEEHNSTPYPNLGWVRWDLSDQRFAFQAGQEVCIDCGFDNQGYGVSNLDILWVFSVEGDDGVLQQDLFSGTGTVKSTLTDLTDSSAFTGLSVPGGFQYAGEKTNLLNDHTYMIHASLSNQAFGDGFEAEYFLSLEDAKITIPEPGPLSLLLFGLAAIGVVRKNASPPQCCRHLTTSFWDRWYS